MCNNLRCRATSNYLCEKIESDFQGLFTPWTMKSSQGLVNYVIGCWTRPETTLGYTKERNIGVTMKDEVPKRHILRSTLSTDMIQRVLGWERQKRCSERKRQGHMIEKYCYNKILMNVFFGGREDEDKIRPNKWSNLNYFQNFPFWTYILKSHHIRFLVHGHSSWSTFSLHLVRGPKALYKLIS